MIRLRRSTDERYRSDQTPFGYTDNWRHL